MSKNEEENKRRAFEELKKIECFLQEKLGGERKKEIVEGVKRKALEKADKIGVMENEGLFTKQFFAPVLRDYFQEKPVDVIVEGMESSGETIIKNDSFGVIGCDFLLLSKDNNFSLRSTIGEIKYGRLKFQSFTGGLGQVIGYIHVYKNTERPKQYGLFCFFNTDETRNISKEDKEFLGEIWERENVFTVII